MAEELMASTVSAVGNITDTNATAAASAGTTAASAGTSSSYRFPADLDVIDHWLDISIFEYSRANRQSDATRKGIKGHITLPLPPKLNTAYSAEYGNPALGVIEHGMGALTRKYNQATTSQDLSSVADAVVSGGASAIHTADGLLRGFALDHVMGAEGVQLTLGLARNPHYAVIYKGPKFRQHDFSWTFFPRNEGESQTLRNIIYLLKYSQAPDVLQPYENHLFKYPDEMEIKFHYPDYLFSIGPSVLTNISVDYHGDSPAYFQNTHAPVQVKLDLSFQETTILTKQAIQNNRR